MKQTITALVIGVEITPYNDEGKVMPRPEMLQFSAFEADIPQEVMEWVQAMLQKARS